MRCTMRVVKNVSTAAIQNIVPLPGYAGKMVTITVTDYLPVAKNSKGKMRESLRFVENAMNNSNRSLDSFRAERLSKYETVD